MSKEELAFRLMKRYATEMTCLECVYYKPDECGHYKCMAEEDVKLQCEEQFDEWLEEGVNDCY